MPSLGLAGIGARFVLFLRRLFGLTRRDREIDPVSLRLTFLFALLAVLAFFFPHPWWELLHPCAEIDEPTHNLKDERYAGELETEVELF